MIRRAINVGLIAGLLLSIAGIYPAISLVVPVIFPLWKAPIANESVHGVLLMLSATVLVPVVMGFGGWTARHARARSGHDGFKVGMIAGAAVGIFCFMTLVSPISALVAFNKIAPYVPSLDMPLPPEPAVMAFFNSFASGMIWVESFIVLMVIWGGIQGFVVGRRQKLMPHSLKPSLFELMRQKRHPREWLIGLEPVTKAGLIVGGGVGILFIFAMLGDFYLYGPASDWPQLARLLQKSEISFVSGSVLTHTVPLLWPLVGISLLGLGALVVIFAKDPATRFEARIKGTILASIIVFLSVSIIGLRLLYMQIGFFQPAYYYHRQQLGQQNMDVTQGVFIVKNDSEVLDISLKEPNNLVDFIFATPWALLIASFFGGWVMGTIQGGFYAFLVPMAYPQPVDTAYALLRRLKYKKEETLPVLFSLMHTSPEVYPLLAQMAVQAYDKNPSLARVAGAYHTLGTSENAEERFWALQSLRDELRLQPKWHWMKDYAMVYDSLCEVLKARTLDEIVAIRPPSEPQTTSLPPMVVKSVHKIAKIVMELHKVDKVADLSTKLIFMENSLEAIHTAERFVKAEMGNPLLDTNLPDQVVLFEVLDHWQEIVLTAVKRIKGRADIVSSLANQQTTYSPHLLLLFQVNNRGLNVAQQVRLRILPGNDYHSANGEEGFVEILPPGESRQIPIELHLHEGLRRMRVEWEIQYDDAVDASRSITFGDVIEFTELAKPFKRIFPIPYVTGTPLKTDNVFVGRDDVFSFIKENLIGAHQNNVIILHGQRRTGKTSVLYRLGQIMSDTHYGVLIDMQGKPARGEVDFLYSIADDIVFALEDHGVEVELPARSEFEESPEFFFRSRFLRNLYPHLQGKSLLLMFDEFEELQRRVEDGRLRPEIFQFLRNLMQHEEPVDFVFSGTHKLEDLGSEYWSILFNIAIYKPITFLSYNDVKQLILEPVADCNIEYDPLAIDRIIEVTAGHPYFTQLVLHEMIVYHNENQRNYLTVSDVNRSLEEIVQRGEAHFKYIWAESTQQEQEVLQGLTELLVSKDLVSVNELREFLGKCGCYAPDNWNQAIIGLEGRDIITRQSSKQAMYRFKVDLIRLWVERTRPSL